jgi:hypothetical protein
MTDTTLPRQSELVLFKLSNGRVTRGRFMNGTHEPCHFEGRTPTWPEVKVVEWAAMPSPDDAGWVLGTPPGRQPSPGREVLALSHGGGLQIRETDEKDPVLPGFWGGEHRLFDSVKAWREVDSLTWQAVPVEIRDREPAWMVQNRLREQWEAETFERVTEELYLAITNDGDSHKRFWGPLASGGSIRHNRFVVRLSDWRGERKVGGDFTYRASAILLDAACIEVWRYMSVPGNKPEPDEDRFRVTHGLWTKIVKDVAECLLDYYQRVRLESLTGRSALSAVAS